MKGLNTLVLKPKTKYPKRSIIETIPSASLRPLMHAPIYIGHQCCSKTRIPQRVQSVTKSLSIWSLPFQDGRTYVTEIFHGNYHSTNNGL